MRAGGRVGVMVVDGVDVDVVWVGVMAAGAWVENCGHSRHCL